MWSLLQSLVRVAIKYFYQKNFAIGFFPRDAIRIANISALRYYVDKKTRYTKI